MNTFLSSESYGLEVGRDFLESGLRVDGYGSERPFKAVSLAKEDINRHGDPLALRFGQMLALSYQDYYRGAIRRGLMDSLALFETVVRYARHIQESDIAWCLPEIVPSDDPFIEIDGMVHPNYIREGIVIGDIKMGGERLANILTGSNDGGKTQFIRGLGQAVTLGHAGYPIPAKRARMSLHSRILTNFSGKDDSSKGRYKRALERWVYILSNADGSLVLSDEPTDGTFPETGINHGIMALSALSRRNVITVSTTHYHEIARAAQRGKIPKAHNLHAETKPKGAALNHTYKILDGADLKSYGDEVAREVGFTEENLERVARGELKIFGKFGSLRGDMIDDDFDQD